MQATRMKNQMEHHIKNESKPGLDDDLESRGE